MTVLLGDLVFVSIQTKRHGITGVQGVVNATGEVADKPDAFWIQVAGLSATLYSDEVTIEKVGN